MKTSLSFLSVIGIATVLLISCGKDNTAPNGPGPTALDTTVVGNWEGAMAPIKIPGVINFNGVFIFVDIAKTDSSFILVARDTSRDTMTNPAIKDTSLVLTGAWRLNMPQDSILLICDTGLIIDTALNVLVPRNVRGQTVPMAIKISKNTQTSKIEWEVAMSDLLPLAPLLGMDLSGAPAGILQMVKVVLYKRSQ